MELRDSAGVWFSRLDRSREERKFYYDFSLNKNERHDAVYRHYGDLPDGCSYGACVFPSMISYADFRDPPFTGIVIVDENGKMKTLTPAEHMHLQPEEHYFPMAIVPSPTGKSLVWITEGDLWTWRMNSREERFIGDDGKPENRFGERKVQDARMHADGILEVLLEDGETLGLFCDEEILLRPFEDGWIPGDEESEFVLTQPMEYWPDSLILMIRKDHDGWRPGSLGGCEFNDCGVRRVCFEPGLETIKAGILAMNDRLETVVVPDHVRQVESFAFGCCNNLKNLVIEGDLSRVADWAGDAFDGCACEEYFKRLRDEYRRKA